MRNRLFFLQLTIVSLLINVVSCVSLKDCNYILSKDEFLSSKNYVVKTKYCIVDKEVLDFESSPQIEGYVYARIGGDPLEAVIAIEGTDEILKSDNNGHFKLSTSFLTPKLRVSHLDFDSFISEPLKVNENEKIKLKIYLGTSVK